MRTQPDHQAAWYPKWPQQPWRIVPPPSDAASERGAACRARQHSPGQAAFPPNPASPFQEQCCWQLVADTAPGEQQGGAWTVRASTRPGRPLEALLTGKEVQREAARVPCYARAARGADEVRALRLLSPSPGVAALTPPPPLVTTRTRFVCCRTPPPPLQATPPPAALRQAARPLPATSRLANTTLHLCSTSISSQTARTAAGAPQRPTDAFAQ